MHEVGVDVDHRAPRAGATARTDAAGRRAEVDPRHARRTRPRPAARPRTRRVRRRVREPRRAARARSGRSRPAPAAAAGRRGTRPSCFDAHWRQSAGSTRPSPGAVSSHENARTRSWPRRDRARRAVVVGQRARSSASASAVFVGRLDEQRGVARDLGDRSGARRDDRHARRHRLEQRETESFVDRRVREHASPRPSSARRPASSTPPGEHDAGAHVGRTGARSRRRPPAAPGRRARRSRAGGRDGRRRARRTRRRGAAGSCAARAFRSRARTARRSRVASSVGAASRDALTERRDAERDHDEAAGRRAARAEDLFDLVGDELEPVCTVAPARDRAPHDRLERAHLGRAQLGVANERTVVDADERRQPARRSEVVRRVHDLRRAQPAIDARHARRAPTTAAARARDRNEACRRRERRRVAGAPAHSACTARARARLRARASAATISATATPIPVRAPSSGVTSIATDRARRRRHARFVAHRTSQRS